MTSACLGYAGVLDWLRNQFLRTYSCRKNSGVRRDGSRFELIDNFMDPGTAHRDLEFEWMGRTVFFEKGVVGEGAYGKVFMARNKETGETGKYQFWTIGTNRLIAMSFFR